MPGTPLLHVDVVGIDPPGDVGALVAAAVGSSVLTGEPVTGGVVGASIAAGAIVGVSGESVTGAVVGASPPLSYLNKL